MVCTTLNLQLSIIINGKILAYKTKYYVQNIKVSFCGGWNSIRLVTYQEKSDSTETTKYMKYIGAT